MVLTAFFDSANKVVTAEQVEKALRNFWRES